MVALLLAAQVGHIEHVAIVRAAGACAALPPLTCHGACEVMPCVAAGLLRMRAIWPFDASVLDRDFPARSPQLEHEDADKGKVFWTDVCYLQLFCAANAHIEKVTRAAPDVPSLVGAGLFNSGPRKFAPPPRHQGDINIVK